MGEGTAKMAAAEQGSFLNKAGPLIIARFLAAIITFGIPMLLARAMNLAEYGTYKHLFLIAMTVHSVLPFGMTQSLYFFIPRTKDTRPYLLQTYGYLAVVGLLFAFGYVAMASQVAAWLSNPGILEYRWLLAAYIAITLGSYPLEVVLTTQGKTRQAAYLYVGSDILRALAMIVPIALGLGLHGAMWAMVGFATLRLLAAWGSALKQTAGPLFDIKKLREQWSYAAPFGTAMLVNMPQQFAHQYAVSAVVTPELFAIYAAGCFNLPLVSLLYQPTSEVLMVRVGELEKAGRVHEAADAYREATQKLAFVFLPLAVFLFVVAPHFIGALLGERFIPASAYFRVSLLSTVLAIFPMDGLLRARGETRYLMFSYFLKAAVTVPLLWFGVTRFGMAGGIASWAIAELIGKASLMARIPKALSSEGRTVTWKETLPGRSLLQAGSSAVGMAMCLPLVRQSFQPALTRIESHTLQSLTTMAVLGVVFLAGYLAALKYQGIDVLALVSSLRKRRSGGGAAVVS